MLIYSPKKLPSKRSRHTADLQIKSGLVSSTLPTGSMLQARATAPAPYHCTGIWVQVPELRTEIAFLLSLETSKAAWKSGFNKLHPPTTPQQKAVRTTDKGNKGKIRNGKWAKGF